MAGDLPADVPVEKQATLTVAKDVGECACELVLTSGTPKLQFEMARAGLPADENPCGSLSIVRIDDGGAEHLLFSADFAGGERVDIDGKPITHERVELAWFTFDAKGNPVPRPVTGKIVVRVRRDKAMPVDALLTAQEAG